MSYRLGVDLGTTFTAAAVANGVPPTMVGLGNRALQIPSVLFLTESGEFLYGEPAERRGNAEPARLVREFKRRIGDSVPILVAGSPYSAQSLTARMLRHVWQTAGERMGGPPGQVVLTHPANWGPYKLELLDQVASLADIGSVVRCPEPVAAAAQYASQNRVEVGDTIAVYDLGGGTFDACVLRKTATGFELVGNPEGIEHLGGIDFDEALFQHTLGLLGSRLEQLDPDDPDATLGLARLRRDCVEAKEALSTDTDTLLAVVLPGLSTTLRLNRGEFESLIRPALRETVDGLGRTLRSANVSPDQLSAIVLIGGSSRIPLVGEMLQHQYGVPTALDTHPKHDVALGAVQARFDPAGTPMPPPPSTVSTLRTSEPPDLATSTIASSPAPPVATTAPPPITSSVEGPPEASAQQAEPPAVRPPYVAPGEPPEGPQRTLPGPADADTPEVAASRRRRILLISCIAAAVVAGVVAGIAIVGNRSSTSNTSTQAGPATTQSTESPPATQGPNGLPVSTALTPDQIVVPVLTGDNWDLWLGDTGEAAPVMRLTSTRTSDSSPVISPDRRTIIYTNDANSDGKRTLFVKSASTPDTGRPLFDRIPEQCADTVFRPAWNPVQPDELAVPCVNGNGLFGLYRFSVDGTLLGTLTLPPGTGRADDVSFSPDGKKLAFWAASPSTMDGGTLYTVPVAGGKPKVLVKTTEAAQDADPVWSPDGKHIAFRRRVPDGTSGGNFDVYTVTTDGSARLKRLTKDPADEQNPIYSPSGDQIAYKSAATDPDRPKDKLTRIWIMNAADGKDARVLWSKGVDAEQNACAWGNR